MPSISSTASRPLMNMDVQTFFSYLKIRFDEVFAVFVSQELKFITPSALTILTMKEINDLSRAVYPDLKTSSTDYYTGDHSDKNGNHELKQSILGLLCLLKKEFTSDSSKKRKVDSTTTSTEMTDAEFYEKQIALLPSNDKLLGKRKRRFRQATSGNQLSYNNEWSFSSDEQYRAPSLEQIYPPEKVSAEDRADFELVTSSRIDYFCQKYLLLTDVIEIRRFQHSAQIQLTMHKEHLYEFLRFIRRRPDLLSQIQKTAEEVKNDEPFKKQLVLAGHLNIMKNTSNFASFSLLLNLIMIQFSF
ncbi:unnamed protein product [Rotaria magnacalcarata]|uniref:Uncharacterized protein n=1 Tax=Rotaria magnacalcarata TaxID=392030 RepID=A0A820A1U6_9BILA|nr:unnamed protein product [Rotaria magnacalcarata]